MLAYLLDEQISPVVAEQLLRRCPGLRAEAVTRWQQGAYTGQPDERLLLAATEGGLTLVTYDLRTIPPSLAEWAASGLTHGGVILVDHHTIRPSDVGRLARALASLWNREHRHVWVDRIVFLEAP
jgi:hypothetical protein